MGPTHRCCMDISAEDLPGGITKVVLQGRFDTTGAVVIELPFNKIVTEQRKIIVDLSAVNFLASYGIRVLLVGAKIVKSKGGNLVILCPDNNVAKVLKTAGMDALIPIHQTETAEAAALASCIRCRAFTQVDWCCATTLPSCSGCQGGLKASHSMASRLMFRSPSNFASKRPSPTSSCTVPRGTSGSRSRSNSSAMAEPWSPASRITAGNSIPRGLHRRWWRLRSRRRKWVISASLSCAVLQAAWITNAARAAIG